MGTARSLSHRDPERRAADRRAAVREAAGCRLRQAQAQQRRLRPERPRGHDLAFVHPQVHAVEHEQLATVARERLADVVDLEQGADTALIAALS
jgi:hypothetical protein